MFGNILTALLLFRINAETKLWQILSRTSPNALIVILFLKAEVVFSKQILVSFK
jgi:hypothetical protein